MGPQCLEDFSRPETTLFRGARPLIAGSLDGTCARDQPCGSPCRSRCDARNSDASSHGSWYRQEQCTPNQVKRWSSQHHLVCLGVSSGEASLPMATPKTGGRNLSTYRSQIGTCGRRPWNWPLSLPA